MTREVLIFLHMDDEHPGYILDFLKQRSIPTRIIRSYDGEQIPSLDESMAGLVFMGGVMSANDDIAWIEQEVELIRQALKQHVPLLGHCLGGQLISRALDQTITKIPVPEVGWHDCFPVELPDQESQRTADNWIGQLGERFPMFHWHNETFSMPPDATALFASAHCQNQAYCYAENVLAMQCHVEMTLPLVTDWIGNWREDLQISSASEQDFEEISENIEDKILALNHVAETLYKRWASGLTVKH